jgi:hypothetical protein
MDIVPSKRLGPFVLGMPVGQALEYLQEHEREISSVQIVIGGNLDGDFILELREEVGVFVVVFFVLYSFFFFLKKKGNSVAF